MTVHEFIREHAVKVNDGSGVLVNCLSEVYSYVLTAKHTLKEVNKIETWDGRPVDVIKVYEHADDCALIQVSFVDSLPLIRHKNDRVEYQQDAIFGGFPLLRSKESTPEARFKTYNGNLDPINNGYYFSIKGLPPKRIIEGASGGGVYLLVGQTPYLIGVEIEMAGPQPHEVGEVECYDLKRFDEIVKANNLAPILPTFLECFKRVRSNTFNFKKNIPGVLDGLRAQLHIKANKLIDAGIPKPHELLALYDKSLILNGQVAESMYDVNLWSSYAEFLVIDAILYDVDVIDLAYLKRIERLRRFVYSRSEDGWLLDLNNIISSARKLLDDGGVLIVSSGDSGSPPVADKDFIKYLVENIASPVGELEDDGTRIDVGLESGDIPFSFALLGSLHRECITRNERDFIGVKGYDLVVIFKEKYASELNKCK